MTFIITLNLEFLAQVDTSFRRKTLELPSPIFYALVRCLDSRGPTSGSLAYLKNASAPPSMYIALKEAGETEYWVELLYEAKYLEAKKFKIIIEPCRVLIRMLSAITKTAKKTSK